MPVFGVLKKTPTKTATHGHDHQKSTAEYANHTAAIPGSRGAYVNRRTYVNGKCLLSAQYIKHEMRRVPVRRVQAGRVPVRSTIVPRSSSQRRSLGLLV